MGEAAEQNRYINGEALDEREAEAREEGPDSHGTQ